jgi:hypothetical protein
VAPAYKCEWPVKGPLRNLGLVPPGLEFSLEIVRPFPYRESKPDCRGTLTGGLVFQLRLSNPGAVTRGA